MATRNLNILMVTNHFYPSVGGLENAARRLATSLISRGLGVTVLTPRFAGLSEFETIDNIPITRFPVIRNPHTRYDLHSKLVYAASLGSHLVRNRMNYDLIHVHQALYAAVVCILFGKLINKRVIVKVAGSGVNGNIAFLRRGFWAGEVLFRIMKHADIFISLSKEIESELLESGIGREKIRNIPNGIRLADLNVVVEKKALKERFGLEQGVFIAIFVGRLGGQKHCKKLLQAWKRIAQEDSCAVLLIAGDGPDREMLVREAHELQITQRVRFLGAVSHVKELLYVSDVFVLPSDSEGMSNSLLEAQAMGVPCVASNEDGNKSMIEDGITGLLFDLSNIDDLTEKLLFVKHHPIEARAFAVRAKREVENKFDIDRISGRYIDLYKELLG